MFLHFFLFLPLSCSAISQLVHVHGSVAFLFIAFKWMQQHFSLTPERSPHTMENCGDGELQTGSAMLHSLQMTQMTLRCLRGSGVEVRQGCICCSGIQKCKPSAEAIFFFSLNLFTIDYSVHFQKQDLFLWWVFYFFIFSKKAQSNCVHTVASQIYTHVRTPDT